MEPGFNKKYQQSSQHKLTHLGLFPQNNLSISEQLAEFLHKIQSIDSKSIPTNDSKEITQVKKDKQQMQHIDSARHSNSDAKVIERQGKLDDIPPVPQILNSKRYRTDLFSSTKNKRRNNKSSSKQKQQLILVEHSPNQAKLYKINTNNQIVNVFSTKTTTSSQKVVKQESTQSTRQDHQTSQALQQENVKLRRELQQQKQKFQRQCQYIEVLQSLLVSQKSKQKAQKQNQKQKQKQQQFTQQNVKALQNELSKYKSLLIQQNEYARELTTQIQTLQLEIAKLIPYKEQKIRLEVLVQQLIMQNKMYEERAVKKLEVVEQLWSVKDQLYTNMMDTIRSTQPIFKTN